MLSRAHLWLGLTIGLIWALQGLTGAVLVFHRELDRAVLPSLQQGDPLPLGQLLATVSARMPAPPESIGRVDDGPSILVVNYTDADGKRRGILLDAATGAILAQRNWRPSSPAEGSTTRWIYELHHRLLLGDAGGLLLGASGLLLLFSASWGLWLAWPRRGAWRATFDVRLWRTRAQRFYGWHRLIGLCATGVLVALAVTGATMDFDKPLRGFSQSHLPYRPAFTMLPGPVAQPVVSADQAVGIARARLPQAAFVSLALPSRRLNAYQVRLRQPGEWRRWSGTSLVTVDPASGRVLDVYDAASAPLANRLLESAFAFHSGEVAGFLGRLAVLFAGLALPTLYVTGVWSWLRRRRASTRELCDARTAASVISGPSRPQERAS